MLFNRGPYYTLWYTKPVLNTNLGIYTAVKLSIFFLQARTPPAGAKSSLYSLYVESLTNLILRKMKISIFFPMCLFPYRRLS